MPASLLIEPKASAGIFVIKLLIIVKPVSGRNVEVSVALREGCPVDGNSGQKRGKGGEFDFGRHDTYSSLGCAVAQEVSVTFRSRLPRCFLGKSITQARSSRKKTRSARDDHKTRH
jgi:hypothetical protein